MSKVTILDRQTIADVMEMESMIAAIEKAYSGKIAGDSVLWPLIFHEFEPETAEMDIKSGYMKEENIYGLKVVSWFERNLEAGIPPLFGTILIFDGATGAPCGLLDAGYLTGMRTGAAGAIGAKYLARRDARNLLIVGAGHQAIFQIAATLTAMDEIDTVRIYDGLDYENAKKCSLSVKDTLASEFLEKYPQGSKAQERFRKKIDIRYEAVSDIETAVKESDIIITITPSRKPIIREEWVKKGTHLSCIGSDTEGKQEVEEGLMSKARIYVDDITQASAVGEIETALKKKLITKDDIRGEIGRVIAGKTVGRTGPDDITVFDSTGIALQDLAAAKLALALAEKKGLGITVDL